MWHAMVHSSMSSPSPTCVLFSWSTALRKLSGFLSSTLATRPETSSENVTDETPPNTAKTKRASFSVQLGAKPRTTMHGLLADAFAGTAPAPTRAWFGITPALSEPDFGVGLAAPIGTLPVSSSFKTLARCVRSASVVPILCFCEQMKCNGPPSNPLPKEVSQGGLAESAPSRDPTRCRCFKPKPCWIFLSLERMSGKMSAFIGPCLPFRICSDSDHPPVTFPSPSVFSPKAASKPSASSLVAKRTYPVPVSFFVVRSMEKMVCSTAPKSSSQFRKSSSP
mmetsp:Transcript_30576/g.71422  ORF Transcript_30576/g.71422 Transcript_30576/m.71422 type:complete len:280 (+) Transcript_30576:1808-2647(+)